MATYIVSGLPRTGTSCMMRALKFAGVEPYEDGRIEPNEANPHGFFEHSAIYSGGDFDIPDGMAAKLPLTAIRRLPLDREYVIVLTQREYEGMAASQREVLGKEIDRFSAEEIKRIGRRNAESLPNATIYEFDVATGEMPDIPGLDTVRMAAAFERGLVRWS